MKTWDAVFSVYASVTVRVQAPTEEEAEEKAWDVVIMPPLCSDCVKALNVGNLIDLVMTREITE